jgi:hypothetical protein
VAGVFLKKLDPRRAVSLWLNWARMSNKRTFLHIQIYSQTITHTHTRWRFIFDSFESEYQQFLRSSAFTILAILKAAQIFFDPFVFKTTLPYPTMPEVSACLLNREMDASSAARG